MATLAYSLPKVVVYAVRDKELRVFRPTIVTLCELNFFLTERFAVRRVRILFVGRTVGDVTINDDQGRAVGSLVEGGECAGEHLQIVGIADASDVPAVAD